MEAEVGLCTSGDQITNLHNLDKFTILCIVSSMSNPITINIFFTL